MLEIRVHGRGGQGAVVASKILASALAKEGNFAQSIPEFGVERRGAFVVAFLRVDKTKVWLRSRIYQPDHIVVLDPTLIGAVDITDGLKPGGWIIINSDKTPDDFAEFKKNFKVATVDASEIAVKYGVGSKTAPITNTSILGALNKVLNMVKQDTLIETIKELSPLKPENNAQAAQEAYDKVRM